MSLLPDPDRWNLLLEQDRLADAGELLIEHLTEQPTDAALLALSRQLCQRLRTRCMGLACNKATEGSREARELEALLRQLIAFNGETLSG